MVVSKKKWTGVLAIAVVACWSLANYRQSTSPVLREYVRSLVGARLDNSLAIVKQINSVDDAGLSPLHHAAIFGDLPLIKFLWINGADPTIRDYNELLPFDYAERRTRRFMLPDQMVIVSYLLEKTWGVNGTDEQGWTALMWAIVSGNRQRIKELVDAGASLDAGRVQDAIDVAVVMEIDNDIIELLGDNAPTIVLSRSLDMERYRFAETLIDRYFLDKDLIPSNKFLAMMIDKRSVKGVRFLLDKGITPGNDELSIALRWRNRGVDLVRMLLGSGAKPTEEHLSLALHCGLFEFAEIFLDDYSIRPTDEHLLLALWEERYGFADNIVEKMVENNSFDPNKILFRAINYLEVMGRSKRMFIDRKKEAVQFLLGYGAVPSKEDLTSAIAFKDEDLVQMLLDHTNAHLNQ